MKVCNLYGGPGSGKSTTAAGVFHKLKLAGINCELVTEFAKDLTWEDRKVALTNQIYIFGKQLHRIHRLEDKVDWVITDSPLALTAIYGASNNDLVNLALNIASSYKGLHYFVTRVKKYVPIGRNQTEQEAEQIDKTIKVFLTKYFMLFNPIVIDGNAEAVNTIVDGILNYDNK